MTEGQANLIAWFRHHASSQEAAGNGRRALNIIEGAVEFAQRCVQLDLGEGRHLFAALLDAGTLSLHTGNPRKASSYLRDALELIDQERIDPTPHEIAEVRQRLGTALDLQEQEAEAAEEYFAALQILQELETPPLDTIAHLQNNLGMIERNRNDFEAAAEYYRQAQVIFENLGEEHHLDLATVCNNEGSLFCAWSQPELARDFHLTALKLRRDNLGDDHPDVGQSACNLAVVYHDMGDVEKASRNYERALKILKKSIKDDPDTYEIVSSNYHELLIDSDRQSQAQKLAKETARLLEKARSQNTT